jgi:regulator of sigma E protease
MSFVWFLLLVGMLITVHEVGHLIAAKLLDIKVLRLSIGFGPRVTALRRGETEYVLALVPLGGYVRLLGEDGEPVAPVERARAFAHRPPWQRLTVILAGPLANLIFPLFLFVHLYAGQATAPSATIGAVFAGQPAAEADLRPGDRVIAVDDEAVRYWEEFNARVAAAPGRELRVTVERPGAERPLTKYVTPRQHLRSSLLGERERVGLIGVAPHYRLPQVGVIGEDSAAGRAGLRTFDLITSVQGRPVRTMADLEPLFNPRGGGMLLVSFVRVGGSDEPDGGLGFASVARLEPHTAQVVPQAILGPHGTRYDAGLLPADLFVHAVEPGTPAAALGLQPGDVLVSLDGAKLTAWELLQQAFEERPLDEHLLAWRRPGERDERQARFHLEPRRTLDEYQAESTLYLFGAETARAIRAVPEVKIEARLTAAIAQALARAFAVTAMMARVLLLTLLGRLPATAIGGPILIYQIAGVAAQHGMEQFLAMVGLVSLNLGLLNLLPVPLLDGGQASLVLVEAVRRRPVSAAARERATVIGVGLLITLMLLASRNDLLRLFVQ